MTTKTKLSRNPSIIIGRTDHERLCNLVLAVGARIPDGYEMLLGELERAILVGDRSVRANVVRMGSTVAYETETGEQRVVTVVFPSHADASQGRISVLTPVGTALLGVSAGQSIVWSEPDGRSHRLTAMTVEQMPLSIPMVPIPPQLSNRRPPQPEATHEHDPQWISDADRNAANTERAKLFARK